MSSQAARIVLTIVFALAVCLLRVQSKDCESCADVPTQKQCGMITLMCGTTVKCVFANDCQMLQRKCLFGESANYHNAPDYLRWVAYTDVAQARIYSEKCNDPDVVAQSQHIWADIHWNKS